MDQYSRIQEIQIRQNTYIFDTKLGAQNIIISIEDKTSGDRWRGEFTSAYIEDVSQKTGNYKKFPVFVKMMMTALDSSSDTVFIDLLTFHDLEMLKSRKKPLNSSIMSSQQASMKQNNKRYLILTYAVEFDRVHYPLPLNFEENPSVDSLKRTIKRLRSELDQFREGDQESYVREITELRQYVQRLQANNSDNSELLERNKELQEEVLRLQQSDDSKIQQLKTENKQLKQELDRLKDEMDTIIEQLEETSIQKRTNNKSMVRENAFLNEELNKAQQESSELYSQLEKAKEQVAKLLQTKKQQNQRIQQLESELQTALKAKTRNSSSSLTRNRSRASSPVPNSPRRAANVPNSPRRTANSPRRNITPSSPRRNVAPRVNTNLRRPAQSPSRKASPNRSFKNEAPARAQSPSRRQSPSRGLSPQRTQSPVIKRQPSPRRQNSPKSRMQHSPSQTQKKQITVQLYDRKPLTARRLNQNSDSESESRYRKKSSVEVSDIDKRLNKLQKLLEVVKS